MLFCTNALHFTVTKGLWHVGCTSYVQAGWRVAQKEHGRQQPAAHLAPFALCLRTDLTHMVCMLYV